MALSSQLPQACTGLFRISVSLCRTKGLPKGTRFVFAAPRVYGRDLSISSNDVAASGLLVNTDKVKQLMRWDAVKPGNLGGPHAKRFLMGETFQL